MTGPLVWAPCSPAWCAGDFQDLRLNPGQELHTPQQLRQAVSVWEREGTLIDGVGRILGPIL